MGVLTSPLICVIIWHIIVNNIIILSIIIPKKLCLVPVQPMTAEEIRTLREREGLSQPVLAWYLNVSKNLISDWERGVRKPGGAALKLLNLVKTKGVQAISL